MGRIADYGWGLSFSDLRAAAVHAAKRRIADTLACGIAAFDEEPCRIARALALRADVPQGARILGTGRRALPELAAFANGVMTRYLDGNDCLPGGGGHPSGVIAPVLAAAQIAGAGGRDVVAPRPGGSPLHPALPPPPPGLSKGAEQCLLRPHT